MPQLEHKWNTYHKNHCKENLKQAMLLDEHSLVCFREDFGKLTQSIPEAVCEPTTIQELQVLMHYAHDHQLPLTIRGNGLSQSGQSLSIPGGMVLSMKHFNTVCAPEADSIWIDANATWASLLDKSLAQSLVPYVVPHNCNLSIGGVLSAGGIGGSSFKYGSVNAHVTGLELVQANGELSQVDTQSPLMHACLGGQGRFAVITKARIALRPCCKAVRTFFLVYLDKESWLADIQKCKNKADYVESFCTPAIMGAKLVEQKRMPFAQWFYALHVSVEFDNQLPDFKDLDLSPWKLTHTQDEPINSYFHRHDSRFNAMKMTGQWELQHPWYECFLPGSLLTNLEKLLAMLPMHYAPVVHIAAIAPVAKSGFLMLPKTEEIFALMILNPGLAPALIPSCLETIKTLDTLFLSQGGKRYLSGYLGDSLDKTYWKNHFEEQYPDWIELKKRYDPQNIFRSFLHPC